MLASVNMGVAFMEEIRSVPSVYGGCKRIERRLKKANRGKVATISIQEIPLVLPACRN